MHAHTYIHIHTHTYTHARTYTYIFLSYHVRQDMEDSGIDSEGDNDFLTHDFGTDPATPDILGHIPTLNMEQWPAFLEASGAPDFTILGFPTQEDLRKAREKRKQEKLTYCTCKNGKCLTAATFNPDGSLVVGKGCVCRALKRPCSIHCHVIGSAADKSCAQFCCLNGRFKSKVYECIGRNFGCQVSCDTIC